MCECKGRALTLLGTWHSVNNTRRKKKIVLCSLLALMKLVVIIQGLIMLRIEICEEVGCSSVVGSAIFIFHSHNGYVDVRALE